MGKYRSFLQIRSVLDTKQIPELLDRAQRVFEKKSGWNRRQVNTALEGFSKLNGVNKWFFGGLLVGRVLSPKKVSLPKTKSTIAPAKKRKSAKGRAQSRA